MAHFAELDKDNKVIRVIVVDNYDCLDDAVKAAHPSITKEFLKDKSGDTSTIDGQSIKWENKDKGKQLLHRIFGEISTWYKTSYNGNFRKNYAGIGYTYDKKRDAFIPPKPYPSWIINETTCRWDAPVPYPQDGHVYRWDELTLSWILVE